MESISVVIPTYNRRGVLVRTLNALNDQDIRLKYEVIVCDDGSSDDTPDTVRRMMEESNFELRYLRHEREGWRLAATRNMGIAAAKGSLIVFVDDDVIPPPSFLSAHYAAHHQPRTVVIGYTYSLLHSSVRGCTMLGLDVRDREFATFPQLARPVWTLMYGLNFSVEHALLDEVGPFDERFQGWGVEDGELAYRLDRAGTRFVLEKKAYGWHQHNPNAASHRLRQAQGLRPDFTDHLTNLSRFRSKYPEDSRLQLMLHRLMTRLEQEQSKLPEVVDAHLSEAGPVAQAGSATNAWPERGQPAPLFHFESWRQESNDEHGTRASVRALPGSTPVIPLEATRAIQPRTSYLICSTPRSGGHLLCDVLRQTGLTGQPREYFGQSVRLSLSRRWGISSFNKYLNKVLELGTTPNGVFGLKVHMNQFCPLLDTLQQMPEYRGLTAPQLLSSVFPNLSYIWLTRRDKVRQAVSYLKADQTGIWQLTDQTPVPAEEAGKNTLRFDVEEIDRHLRLIEEQERAWQDYFEAHAIKPLVVIYEELTQTQAATACQVLEYLHIPKPAHLVITEPRTKRQADALSQEWVERYLQLKRSSPLQV